MVKELTLFAAVAPKLQCRNSDYCMIARALASRAARSRWCFHSWLNMSRAVTEQSVLNRGSRVSFRDEFLSTCEGLGTIARADVGLPAAVGSRKVVGCRNKLEPHSLTFQSPKEQLHLPNVSGSRRIQWLYFQRTYEWSYTKMLCAVQVSVPAARLSVIERPKGQQKLVGRAVLFYLHRRGKWISVRRCGGWC